MFNIFSHQPAFMENTKMRKNKKSMEKSIVVNCLSDSSHEQPILSSCLLCWGWHHLASTFRPAKGSGHPKVRPCAWRSAGIVESP